MPPDDAFRLSMTYMSALRIIESGYRSWQEGIVSEEEVWTGTSLGSVIWDVPFFTDSWPIWKREIPLDFATYLESALPQLKGLGESDQEAHARRRFTPRPPSLPADSSPQPPSTGRTGSDL